MKIKKDQLKKVLEIVKPGLASKDVIEQTTSFAFLNGKVMTYNDWISISHPIEDLSIKGAIYAEELYKLLQKVNTDEIDIENKTNEIYLKFKKGTATFALQQKIKIPIIEIKGEWQKIPIDFIHHLKFAMAACATDMSQPELTCINVQKEGILQASDGYKICYCELSNEMPINTFLLPVSSANEVIKINPIYINKEDDKWVHFKNKEGTIISCRLGMFEKNYPNLKKHLDVNGVKIKFPKAIVEILDRAWVFAKRDTELNEEMTINIQSKELTIFSRSETGSFSEKTLIRYEGQPIEFVIVPYLLIDILKETNHCVLGENAIKFKGEGWQYVSVLQSKE